MVVWVEIVSFVHSQDSQNITLGDVHLSFRSANTWAMVQ